MTRSRTLLAAALFVVACFTALLAGRASTGTAEQLVLPAALISDKMERPHVADIWETYRDPATNRIPADMRRRELAYVRDLPKRGAMARSAGALFDWVEAGPSDIGGRTRVLAFDVTDSSTILTGGVSGGIWKSNDGGATWTLKTTVNEHPSVTALVQDPRPGHTDTWYYGSGEWFGDGSPSDRGFTAIFNGVGVYKSEDNGETWSLLPATADPNPTGCCNTFDYVHRLAINPNTGTLFVASNVDGIYRSDDGGASFSLVLGTPQNYTWTEVVASPNGTLVAALSSEGSSSGIYRSTNDGQSWEPITPSTFPSSYRRVVITLAPSNPDAAYVMTWVAPNRGDGREDVRLHKINIVTGTSEDRTANLPNFPGASSRGASIRTQNTFTMALGVKPDNEDFVFIGGVSIFRSRDGFATPLTDQADGHIGGYVDFDPTGGIFENHWVDNHLFVFHPENPDELWSAHDAGLSIMRDATAPPVWEAVDTGYNVAQFYGVDIADASGDRRIAGGLQDFGSVLFADLRPDTPGFSGSFRLSYGDGGYFHIGEAFTFGTFNTGQLVRWRNVQGNDTLMTQGGLLPLPPAATGRRFINPFAMDPNDEQVMYYPAGQVLWRGNNVGTSSPSWSQATSVPAGFFIRAIAVSRDPAHTVYLGANNFNAVPRVFRVREANTGQSVAEEISIPGAPLGAYVHNISVNPEDGDEVLLVMSNYNIVGLYHSTDAGDTWTAVEGNLHGGGLGPSLRASTIVPAADGSPVYIVATSAGVFSTQTFDGMSTVWEQEAFDQLGNIVVEHITSRPSDGRVAAASHGRGIWLGDPLFSIDTEPTTAPEGFALAQNYPNPFATSTQIGFTLPEAGQVMLAIFDVQGRRVAQLLDGAQRAAGSHTVPFDAASLVSGTYLYQLDVTTSTGRAHRAAARMTLMR